MSWRPVSGTVPQYSKNQGGSAASDFFLKFFAAGTTTPILMSTDVTGGTQLAKARLNAEGYPRTEASEDSIFIPHIEEDFKIGLFPTEADADAGTNAVFLPDNVPQMAALSDVLDVIADLADGTDLSKGVALVGRAIQTFESVAQMITAPLTNSQVVRTQSYSSGWEATVLGPLGGADYQIVTKAEHDTMRATSTVDGFGDHTLNNGAVALLVYRSRIDVTQFGAVPDGSKDKGVFTGTANSPAIQAAIDALADDTISPPIDTKIFGVGGTIYFPAGVYMIDQLSVSYTGDNYNIIFEGDGPGATVIKTSNVTGGDIITVEGNPAGGDSMHGFFARDLSIEGNYLCGMGFSFSKAVRQTGLDRVAIHNTGSHGVEFNNTSNMITVMNCRIYRDNGDANFEQLSGDGIRATLQGEQIWLYGNSIRGWAKGLSIGQNTNICNVYGGDITSNVIGTRITGGTANDGRASGIEIRGVYYEQNGIDIDLNGGAVGEETQSVIIGGNSFTKTTGLDRTYGQGSSIITSPTTVASITIRRVKNITIEPNEFRKIGVNANAVVQNAIHIGSNANGVEIRKQNYQTGTGITNIVQNGLISVDSSSVNVSGFLRPDINDDWDRQLRPVTIQRLAVSTRLQQEINGDKLDMDNCTIIHMQAEGGGTDQVDFLQIPQEAGRIIILKPDTGQDTITVRDVTSVGSPPEGYDTMQIGGDFAMDPNDTLTLYYDEGDSSWYQLARSNN